VTRRFWVRAAVLTAVRTKIFTKLEGSGKISGVAFAAGGDVFHSAEALSEDRQIWMSVVDVKELAATAAPTTALPAALQRAIDAGAIKYHYDKDGRLADVSVKTLPQGLQLPPDWQSTMKAYAHETEQALTKATAVVRPPANRIRPLRVINGR